MKRTAFVLSLCLCLALGSCAPGGAPDDDDPPPEPVAVNIIENAASVEVGHTFQFHYSVSNTANTSCTWSVDNVAGGNATVGTVDGTGLYTAPAAVPTPAQVTVKAVAVADASKSDTATVTVLAPPPFTISPATATVPAGASQPFTTTADVYWSLEGADGNTAPLGSIGTDGVFTAPLAPPLGGEVTVVATSKTDPSIHATAVAAITFSNASFHGPYAFVFRGADAGGPTFIGGRLTADGAGAITEAHLHIYQGAGKLDAAPFTGAYQVQADGRAALTLSDGETTKTLRGVLASDDSAHLIGSGPVAAGSGEIERQEASALSGSTPLGTFVFGYDGTDFHSADDPKRGQPIAAAGRFVISSDTLDPIHDGIADINRNGQWIEGGDSGSTFFGWITYQGYGWGYMRLGHTLGADQFAYFMLSPDEALLIGWYGSLYLGETLGVIGRMARQTAGPFSASSLSGALADISHGYRAVPVPTPDPFVPAGPAFSAGVVTANGAGQFTSGLTDTNVGGTVGQGSPVTGTYAVAANGRGTASITAGGLTNTTAVYLASNNSAVATGLDTWGTGLSAFSPRTAGPFGVGSLDGHYAFTLRGTLTSPSTDVSGQILFNGLGALAGAVDINAAGVLATDVPVTGSYTMEATGRGVATITAPAATWTVTLYVKDAATVLLLGTSFPSNGTLVRQY
ncbi:MAG: hypothetical protein KA243_01665 [Candidatus Aminicenantes bacterium]|nr:hypothetical protein [Candidatus Aminicenantes bacterium]NLH77779.1 hypothetical protein [Acidobacteriota bacterium]